MTKRRTATHSRLVRLCTLVDPYSATEDAACSCAFHGVLRGEPTTAEGAEGAPLEHGHAVFRALHAEYLGAMQEGRTYDAGVLAYRMSLVWQVFAIATFESA